MTRRTFLLMGVAILAVVVSHAAGYGQIAMIYWADRYRQVTVPNFDQVGSLSYYILLVIRQLTVFAVPAFLFCSGFFVAYAARGSRGVYSWKMARTRVVDLLIPYAIWSVLWFITDALQRKTYTPIEYVTRLITGTADGGGYFFIPLLCQFYLMSPLIVRIAKFRPKLLLAVALAIQLITFVVEYLHMFHIDSPIILAVRWIVESWLFFAWAGYFALGLVTGFHTDRVKQTLQRLKGWLVAALIVLAVLAVIEPEVLYWATRDENRSVPFTFATILYSFVFILAFIFFDKILIPYANQVQQLGGKSYGIYLTHIKVIEFAARVIRQIAPWMLAFQVLLLFPILVVIGLAGPLLLMKAVSYFQSTRRFYRYLFG